MKFIPFLFLIVFSLGITVELTKEKPEFCLVYECTDGIPEIFLSYETSIPVLFSVSNPRRVIEYSTERSSQEFSFVPTIPGDYRFCFLSHSRETLPLSFSYRHDDPLYTGVIEDGQKSIESSIYELRERFSRMHVQFGTINNKLQETLNSETSNTSTMWLALLLISVSMVLNLYLQVRGLSVLLVIRSKVNNK